MTSMRNWKKRKDVEKLAQPIIQKEVDELVREHLRYYGVTDKDILNFKANNKSEYDNLFGEAEARADEKILYQAKTRCRQEIH